MSARELMPASGYDDDTFRILDISLVFLVRFFGHSEAGAKELLREFNASFASYYDEDALHHESSYRVAAMIHYLVSLGGAREELGEWLHQEGHTSAPPEALEFFRENYFVK